MLREGEELLALAWISVVLIVGCLQLSCPVLALKENLDDSLLHIAILVAVLGTAVQETLQIRLADHWVAHVVLLMVQTLILLVHSSLRPQCNIRQRYNPLQSQIAGGSLEIHTLGLGLGQPFQYQFYFLRNIQLFVYA